MLIFNQEVGATFENHLLLLKKFFDSRQLIVMKFAEEYEKQMKLMRFLSQSGVFAKIEEDFENQEFNDELVIIFNDNIYQNDFHNSVSYIKKGLVIFKHNSILDQVGKNFNLRIDQELYLFDENNGNLYETYSINNVEKMQKLGYFNSSRKNFAWEPGMTQK